MKTIIHHNCDKMHLFQICKFSSAFKIIIYQINKQQKKNDIIISINIEKNVENLEHTFMKKNHQGRSRGELPQLDRDHPQNIYSNLKVRHWIIFP